MQIRANHRQMAVQAALTKSLQRRAVLAISTHHQIDARLIGSPIPLRLAEVVEHLLFQHPCAVFNHRRQLPGMLECSATGRHRISPGTVENDPVHLESKQRIAVVPKVEAVTLRRHHLAPDIHVIALIDTDFAAANPNEMDDLRNRPGQPRQHFHGRRKP